LIYTTACAVVIGYILNRGYGFKRGDEACQKKEDGGRVVAVDETAGAVAAVK
jgi:hypothetical protein